MSDKERQRYFNFPIVLLEGFLVNDKGVLNNIWDYATYVEASSYERYSLSNKDIEKAVRLSDMYPLKKQW